jgi:hypothetical protein
MATRTPSQGLKILENLHKKYPNHLSTKNSVINAYIKLGKHDTAINMIKDTPSKKSDMTSLRHQAWLTHKENNIVKEREIWHQILEINYMSQIHNKIETFIARSQGDLTLKFSDIPLFCVERNEMVRLPFFLDYYRKLGVTKFIFIDNNSHDGSLEFLLQQPDCYVFWTNDSYNQSGHGLTWLNYLINQSGILHDSQWYIIADVDEFLVYPNCEIRSLKTLIAYLNTTDAEAVPSFMLDMYPKDLENSYPNFLEEHIYFYNNYQIFYQVESPYIQPSGGIRSHIFDEHNSYYVKTALFKKIDQPIYLISSTHQTTPFLTSNLITTFLHYKFAGDFELYTKSEINNKQHSGGGSRYRIYHNWITNNPDTNFIDLDKTTKYQNSQQLVDLGLIKTTEEWEKFCENQ